MPASVSCQTHPKYTNTLPPGDNHYLTLCRKWRAPVGSPLLSRLFTPWPRTCLKHCQVETMSFTLVSAFLWCKVKIVKACPERAFSLGWEIVFPLLVVSYPIELCVGGQGKLSSRGAAVSKRGPVKKYAFAPAESWDNEDRGRTPHLSLPLTGIPQIICQKDRAKVSNTSFGLKWHGTHQIRDWEPPGDCCWAGSPHPCITFPVAVHPLSCKAGPFIKCLGTFTRPHYSEIF